MVASKLSSQQADTLQRGGDAEISENLCFFIKRSVAPNLQIETFLGPAPTDSPRTQLSEYLQERYVRIFFVRVIPVRSRERAAKRDLPAKIGHRNKKTHGHNFRRRGPKTNSVFRNPLFQNAIRFRSSPSKIVAVSFFVTVPYFCWQIPFCRPLPTSDRNNSDKKNSYIPFLQIF